MLQNAITYRIDSSIAKSRRCIQSRRKPVALSEYIYVNTQRLDAYFEQISSPFAYDKVPSISVDFSLLGPKVGAEQTRNARAFNTHEKITKLLAYLGKHDQILNDSPFLEASDDKPFVMHNLYAKRIFIPPIADSLKVPDWFKGLGMWISTRSSNNDGRVYLLEDLRQADGKIEFMSAYSSLNMLRQEFVILSEYSIVAGTLNDSVLPDEDQSVAFSTNPLEFLARLGAQLLPEERYITSLYRIRTFFLEQSHSEGEKKWKPNVVGYPIFITAGEPF